MRRHTQLVTVLLLSAATVASCVRPPQAAENLAQTVSPHCTELIACEQRLRSLAASSRYGGVGAPEEALAVDFRGLGEPAWERIAALSLEPDKGIRNVASYVMAEWRPLNEEKIPAIKAALAKEPGGWPARALGRIATPTAIEALIEDVERAGSGNQSTWALGETMPESLPAIVAALQAGNSGRLSEGVSEILSRLEWLDNKKTRQDRVVHWLLLAASNQAADETYRREVTLLLLSIMPGKGLDLSGLHANLQASDKKLRWATLEALSKQGDPFVLDEVLAQCQKDVGDSDPLSMGEHCLDSLARMGRAARAAVPLLLNRLNKANPDSRNMIIATLGYIADRSVVPVLIDRLKSSDDRDVSASLEALWRLDAKDSIPVIQILARSHWYGPIRDFASRVATALSGGDVAPVRKALERGFRDESLSSKHLWGLPLYSQQRVKDCVEWKVGNRRISRDGYIRTIPAELKRWQGRVKDASSTVPFAGGALLGINKGEFGGGLVYVNPHGERSELSGENVHGLLPRGNEILALTGLAHLMDSGGWIQVVAKGVGSAPRIVDRRRLPSAPDAVFNADDGWLILMASHEAVLLRPDLSLAEVACSKLF